MNTAVINIKTEEATKKQAQQIAKELGMSLSSLINAYLKQLIRTKRVAFDLSEEPSEYFINSMKKSEEDIKAGRVSQSFDNADDAIAWLDDPNARYQNGDKVQR